MTKPTNNDRAPTEGRQPEERSALERMKDLARRIVAVPKSEIPKPTSTKSKKKAD